MSETGETDFSRGARAMKTAIIRRIEGMDIPSTWKFLASDTAKYTQVIDDNEVSELL